MRSNAERAVTVLTTNYWMDTALVAMNRLREMERELYMLNKRIEDLTKLCEDQVKKIQEFEARTSK